MRAPFDISRRTLFSVVGSGVILASAGVFWRRSSRDADAAAPRSRILVSYADHDGWMVTPEEKQRLTAAGTAPR